MQRGKWAVVFMLVLGLSAAVFAWQWNRARGRQAAEFWGADVAKLIRSAKQVEAFRLDGGPFEIEPKVLETKDVSKAPGLLHARNALLEDASFEREHPSAADPLFKYAVRFTDGERHATLYLDPNTRQIRSDRRAANGELVPKVSEGWRKAFERYFATAAKAD